MAGFGVRPGDLQAVARRYEDEGHAVVALSDQVRSGVGAGQVGRRFTAVAQRYRALLDELGGEVAAVGAQAVDVATRLREAAQVYEWHEDDNQPPVREQGDG